jgi:hypothetical protein
MREATSLTLEIGEDAVTALVLERSQRRFKMSEVVDHGQLVLRRFSLEDLSALRGVSADRVPRADGIGGVADLPGG